MIAADIKNILNEREYCYYGLRADSFDYKIGDVTNVSHQLFQNPQYDDYGELKYHLGEGRYSVYYDAGELDGTCAVEVTEYNLDTALKDVSIYDGKSIYLIAGNAMENGNDYGEIIIKDAVILYKVERGSVKWK